MMCALVVLGAVVAVVLVVVLALVVDCAGVLVLDAALEDEELDPQPASASAPRASAQARDVLAVELTIRAPSG